ncbi:MAG TPA: condensation domain-containing protein, partial [Thermoanaerobaculia bacterium]|nr:condensation domain-containing protein [Thermoanaerobaculia bacterium]
MSVPDQLSQRVANLSPAKLRLLMKHLGKEAPDPGEGPRRRTAAGPVPLSFSQQRLWFLDRLEPGGTAYSLPSALRLAGRLDRAALAAALAAVVARHEVLRTTFVERDGDPVQVIHRPAPLALPLVDLAALPAGRAEAEARRLVRADGRRPFDLTRGPLFRNLLLRLAAGEHVLLQNLHHIVSDAWSRTLMVREMVGLYEALAAGRRPELPEPALQYGDYCLWQRERVAGPALDTLLGWWRERLAGAPLVEMPADRPRPAERTGAGGVVRRPLPARLPERLGELGRGSGATPFMTLLAGLAALVHRHTGETDLVIGTPIANRREAALEGVLGFFVNTLALRLDLAGDPSFRELVGRVRETALESYARQELPFEKLVEELAPERTRGRSPLFQGLFVLENVPPARLEIPGLTFTALETDNGAAKFDWGLSVEESPDGWRLRLEYATDLYEAATVERWLDCYGRLLAAAAARPELRLSELPLLADGERRQVVAQWNATAREYAGPEVLTARLAAQAAATPEATALVCGDERPTYAEFEARVCRLARHLGRLGIGPESRVGVFAERGVEMVEAIHAVVRAGAAY